MRRPILDKKTAVQTGSVARAGVGGSQAIAPPSSAAALFQELVERGCSLAELTDSLEKWYVLRKMEICEYNQSKAAKALGIHRNTLIRRLNEWGYNRKLRRFE